MTILVTGGAGFIASNFILDWLNGSDEQIVNLDKLTSDWHVGILQEMGTDPRHIFVQGDIGDKELVKGLLEKHKPRAVLNFAAETHVDHSIAFPEQFVETNILKTFYLLEIVNDYYKSLEGEAREGFRFLQVSTDEVYGALQENEAAFTEDHPVLPNNPYSATKAAADHIIRSYHHTYGLPILTTHSSNNYGPHQSPEKLIPLVIKKALSGEPLPVFGDGKNIRDWIYVGDHCAALCKVLEQGKVGEIYNIGGNTEKRNIDLVREICVLLDIKKPRPSGSYADLIAFVKDRPGHDRRYAINSGKMARDLLWTPQTDFNEGLRKTLKWYLDRWS